MQGPLVLLVRHGETAGNASGRMQPPSEPLSSTGRWQAEKLGESLRAAETNGDFRIAVALVSDLMRTLETADGIFHAIGKTGRKIRNEPLLQERNFGDLRGQFYAEFTKKYGNVFAEDFAPPGGETWPQFRRRVAQAWSTIKDHALSLPPPQAGIPEPAAL
eukprot:TRINITY_DN35408_c0_g1_i1.p1 TRINITY_DN35408_c0_g1~~TRINITY_DN35408_c0_g1_i1.p1  ORF type:complete len:161 (-),score=30.31 TRINITY_DN35408_c0_g1_i1:119-601(-)